MKLDETVLVWFQFFLAQKWNWLWFHDFMGLKLWNYAFSRFYAKTALFLWPVSVKLGQLFEFQGSFLKLGWNCEQFHLSLLKIAYLLGKQKICPKNVARNILFFVKKIIENEAVSKKVILGKIFVPFFNFCHDFKIFETVKYVFLQVKKLSPGTCIFLLANSPENLGLVIRFGCLVLVKLGQFIDHDEYSTIFLWNQSFYLDIL